MNTIYCLLLMLCPCISPAQPPVIKSLTIGDKVPDMPFTQIVNGQSQSTSLARYKGKLLVLNFMQTTCSSCISSLPRFNELQSRYSSQVQLVLVTPQRTAVIRSFLQKNSIGRKLSLPFITADTLLRSCFPHQYISHLVWIGPDGIVKAITGAQYLTGSNLQLALLGSALSWPVKTDLPAPELGPPFLVFGPAGIPPAARPSNTFYSAFYRHMPGMPEGAYRFTDSTNGTSKTLFINLSVPGLYRKCYGLSRMPLSHILLRVQQPQFFRYNPQQAFKAGWDFYNTFCYELVQPLQLAEQQNLQHLLAGISYYTQTTAYLTDTVINGFILKDTPTTARQLLSTRPAAGTYLSVSGMLYTLNNSYAAPPVTDGRSSPRQAWLPIAAPALTDIPALNQQLLPYGLVLQPQPQNIQALVIAQTGIYPFIHSPKLYAK